MTDCPDPSVHGNPFRYCPYCEWRETDPAADLARVRRSVNPEAELAALRAGVEALHRPRSMEFLPFGCGSDDAADECDHDGDCPTESQRVCAACYEHAELVDPYFTDRPVPDFVLWPCPTAALLAQPGRDTPPPTADCAHEWEVEYLPDPQAAGGVVRSGDLVCPRCFVTRPDAPRAAGAEGGGE